MKTLTQQFSHGEPAEPCHGESVEPSRSIFALISILALFSCTRSQLPPSRSQNKAINIPVVYFTVLPCQDTAYYNGLCDFAENCVEKDQQTTLNGYFNIGLTLHGNFNPYDLQNIYDIPQSLERAALWHFQKQDPMLYNVAYQRTDSLKFISLNTELYHKIKQISVYIK